MYHGFTGWGAFFLTLIALAVAGVMFVVGKVTGAWDWLRKKF